MALSDFDRSRAAWWVFGAVLAAALAFVVYSFVGTVVFGVFLYYATRPVYRRLRRRLGNRTLAAGVSLVALAAPALALAGYALLLVVTQAQRVVEELTILDFDRIPGVDQELLATLSDPERLATVEWTQYVTADTAVSTVDSVLSAADAVAFFGVGALHLFVMFAIAFYLLRDGNRLRQWLTSFGDDRGVAMAYGAAVDRDYRNIFFGNILNAVFTGTIGVVVYSGINIAAPPATSVPAPALVGLLAGVASLVPVVGMKLVYVPVAGYMGVQTVATSGTEPLWFVAVFVLVSFVIVDTIPDLLLRPYVSGRSLHVGMVMLAYTLGPLLFGWYGIFLLPMVLVLVVQFAKVVLPELVADREFRPYGVDPAYLDDDAPQPSAASDDTPTGSTPDGSPAPPSMSPDSTTTDGGRGLSDDHAPRDDEHTRRDDDRENADATGTDASDTAATNDDPFQYGDVQPENRDDEA